jgi:hypothetical protein
MWVRQNCRYAPDPLAAHASSNRSARAAFLVVGAWLALLGGWRAIEVVPLVGRYQVENEPGWLLPYLAVITLLVGSSGVGLILTGLTLPRHVKLAGIVGRVSCALLAAFVLVHGYFLINYEDAFADGGMIWGFFHILTLTRLPTTGTEAGTFGYRIGTAIGMAVWLACCVVMFGKTVLGTRRDGRPPPPSEPEGSPAIR